VPGFTVPVHRALTEPILLGGAPRAIAILNGTLAGARRPRPAPLAGRPRHLGHRPFRGRLGGQARSALRRGRRRHLRIPAHLVGLRRRAMMNLAEYRRTATAASPTSCPGRAGRRRRRPQQGRQLPAHGALSRSRSRFRRRRPSWSPSPAGSTTPSAVSAPAGRSSSRRSAIEAATYPDSRFPIRLGLVDAERKADFEEAGAHFESSYFLTFLYLPPAEDAARAETWLYEGREQRGVDPMRSCAASSTAPTACCALLDGFMPECRWLDDGETLTYLHSTASRPSGIASACPKRRSISTRCSPISR
jgi:hypothetical protein